ncbi:MAG: exosome complex RNA-binding protein Csl4 [Promethearchaeota archaeon]
MVLLTREIRDGDYVTVGEPIAVIEQFFGESGTYESDGTIYASVAGIVSIDHDRKKIRVRNEAARNVQANRGDRVVGVVTSIRTYSVGVAIYKIGTRMKFEPVYGNVHVSKVDRRYVEKLEDAFVVGDVVRAKVLGMAFNEYDLTTEYRELGVIWAECSVCGQPLYRERHNSNELTCRFCGNRERRKLANDYMQAQEKITFPG